jgi:hypothetical protein
MPRARTAPARAETEPRSETPGAPVNAAVAPTPSDTPRELQAVPSVAASPVNQQTVQGAIDRADGLLRGIDPKKLNSDAKSNFDEARKFLGQAKRMLAERNFVSAGEAADKAFKLAQSVTGR